MPGCYVHIPFCRQACHYCDFHFSTALKSKSDLLRALSTELEQRSAETPIKIFDTLYFGGGTPSLLERTELGGFFDTFSKHFSLAENAEITLEANPDDLTEERLSDLRVLGINRLSIGIQSFSDEDLRYMNRAHTAAEALAGVKRAQDMGFENITIDLIYGAPTTSHETWEKNLVTTLSLGVPHVSAYCLTVEPRTALAHFIQSGKSAPVDDRHGAEQFRMLTQALAQGGFEQYEISNFAKPGRHSRHNSSYWSGAPYLGIGPSAHSFDGTHRRWNVANNAQYIRALQDGETYFESETLSAEQHYNEYVMTRLRTKWGCELETLRSKFGEAFVAHFTKEAAPWIASGDLILHDGTYVLSEAGKLLADRIASDLFWV